MSVPTKEKISSLRKKIQESLRVQLDTEGIEYLDASNDLDDATAKQNHVIFARRGCGKTLLMHSSSKAVSESIGTVYLNCEDFKQHSFPNVLIEILKSIFLEIDKNISGWFGKKKKSKELIKAILAKLDSIQTEQDEVSESIRELDVQGVTDGTDLAVALGGENINLKGGLKSNSERKEEIEKTYTLYRKKLEKLELWIPELKRNIRDFISLSSKRKFIFIQVDDLYHLKRTDQAFVVDYIHRLCKDVPMFFKLATLRHASVLYIDRQGQPIGAQERHDYQSINIDYTFGDFPKTEKQNWIILRSFAYTIGMTEPELGSLFKGEGFARLVMAGGGVPRDVLSLFLEILTQTNLDEGGKIGKDEVRLLSKTNFEKRIEELKHDAQDDEQLALLRGIYLIKMFCLEKQTNIFLIKEQDLQENEVWRALIYRLLDYRIIHNCATTLTHKSTTDGSYSAFAIDIGSYAFMRKHQDRFKEIDVASREAKDQMRSMPILSPSSFDQTDTKIPKNIEEALTSDE
jgi:hypothetical protein